jgi:hypothetical protein
VIGYPIGPKITGGAKNNCPKGSGDKGSGTGFDAWLMERRVA